MSITPLVTRCVLPLGLVLFFLVPSGSAEPPLCSFPAARLSEDYAQAIGSAKYSDSENDPETGSTFRWLKNGTPLVTGAVAEGLLLSFEGQAEGANGETPSQMSGAAFVPGCFGQSLSLSTGGNLWYPSAGNLNLLEGTWEAWVAPRADGDDPVYSSRTHIFVYYRAPSGDWLYLAQASNGVLYAGGTTNGQWQSAYNGAFTSRTWKAGQWHHLVFTYSAAGNFMRVFVDGRLAADTNESRYIPPSPEGDKVAIGGDFGGSPAWYDLDEVRLSGRPAGAEEIAARAERTFPPAANEIWQPTAQLAPGDELIYEFTPVGGGESGTPCQSLPLVFPGIPVVNPSPASTLLPPGSSAVHLSVESSGDTLCRWSVGADLGFEGMTPFPGETAPGTVHHASLFGLDPDPDVINHVYVRCASNPDFLLHLRYRSLSEANPDFPRTGNLWGYSELIDQGLAAMARIDLWFGPEWIDPDQIRTLRELNPDIRVFTSINAVENRGLPDDYYLKDTQGRKIEVWPGSFRLNLTKLYVAEFQAHYAYETILNSGLMADGVFFDNVMTTQSWLKQDIYGNPVRIDANEDGTGDDPAWLDAAWKAGVFHEIRTFRTLVPAGLASGHSIDIDEPGIAELFNGLSMGFVTANVIEGQESFTRVRDRYFHWIERAVPPPVTMFEASPLDEIAYGYGYAPWSDIPPATLEFARTYGPWMRFGLALTLLNDGFFAYEYGDTWHGNDWWYDELDFSLGQPLGPAEKVNVGFDPGPNLIVNPGFEQAIVFPWNLWANTSEGCFAQVIRDTSQAAVGQASARVDIAATSGVDWHIEFAQYDRSIQNKVAYDLIFWAKADRQRSIGVSCQKDEPDWDNYGLYEEIDIGTEWKEYSATFTANTTASDARIQFFLGAVPGAVWLDQVRLKKHAPDVFRRDYTRGMVLLNASNQTQTVALDSGFRRLTGEQIPRVQTIIDDLDAGFGVTGIWTPTTYDSGTWKVDGPFYHDWGTMLRQLTGQSGEARWNLTVPAADTYTVEAWWPAAPSSSSWNSAALFEIVANGSVAASMVLDQRTGGDQWHPVGTVFLNPSDGAFVRLICSGDPCVADAVYLHSAARYNDGSPATSVSLAPLDGIVLARDCDGGSPPGPVSDLVLGENRVSLSWTRPAGAASFDLVLGDLVWLRATSGDFSASLAECLVDDQDATRAFHYGNPERGSAFFYLVRGAACEGSPGTYDEQGVGQNQSRDAAIASSPEACP